MYITAHRVQEQKHGESAIHVFLHVHDGDDLFTGEKTDAELLKQITEAEPGRLVDKEVVLPPGGNRVMSYLDVIAPDTTALESIQKALGAFRTCVADRPLPVSNRYDPVLVCFGAEFGLRGVEAREYDCLHAALESLAKRFYASRKP